MLLNLLRLKPKVKTSFHLYPNDGFQIAEKDLELRGAGDIYGLRQSGLMDLKIANPIRDSSLLLDAQNEAIELGKNETGFAKTLVERWIGNRVDYSDS